MSSCSCDYVVVYPYRLIEARIEHLLLLRSDRVPLSGIWQPVTGCIEPGETAVEAGLRELHEETGLRPVAVYLVDEILPFYDWRKDRVQLTPALAARVDTGGEVRLSEEHTQYQWVDGGGAEARVFWRSQKSGYRLIEGMLQGGREPHPYLRVALPGEGSQTG